MVKLDTDVGLPNPHCSGTDLSPSPLPGHNPANQSFLAPNGHVGPNSHLVSELIGAVRMPGPFRHTTGHMACGPHHMGHMHGQGCQSATSCQIPGEVGMTLGDAGSKGGHLGGPGFGFSPYVGSEGVKNMQTLSAWDHQVSLHEATDQTMPVSSSSDRRFGNPNVSTRTYAVYGKTCI